MPPDFFDPLGMKPDPYAGDSFVLSESPCTDHRRFWLKRSNEIIGFFIIGQNAFHECEKLFTSYPSQNNKISINTPFKLSLHSGHSIVAPLHRVIKQLQEGKGTLSNQIFVMLYGSFEAYLFDIIERSYREIGKNENLFELSLEIMMRKNWDGKFCKLRDVFRINYRSSELRNHFKGFKMEFNNSDIGDPLSFLDKLAQIRHKIVHTVNIMQSGEKIFIKQEMIFPYYAFFYLLTDYIDLMFSRTFGYERIITNPANPLNEN